MRLNDCEVGSIAGKNLKRAEKFYTDVLGFPVTERYSEEILHLMLDTGHTTLHIFESPDLNIRDATECLSEEGYAHIAFGTTRKNFPKVIEKFIKLYSGVSL